ncbi:hypothetical protein N8T08_008114 [Aspergillus melleus]|uniref:Uncharacterized protein n=1 Tax=Aspergillus melleus TaxID=138277 RepID=A0ACC3AWF8_9EURO|nr:hypothetical protein N8T08_008114 [Aspergillus melleus]
MKSSIAITTLALNNIIWAQSPSDDKKHHCIVGLTAARYPEVDTVTNYPSIILQGYCQDNSTADTPESDLYTKAECDAMRDPIINTLVKMYGQHNIGQHQYVPEYGYAKEILNDTMGDPPSANATKNFDTWIKTYGNQTAWVTFMHAQMAGALKQAKEKGEYPECTSGEQYITDENRLCLQERLNVCEFAWPNSEFVREHTGKMPQWN